MRKALKYFKKQFNIQLKDDVNFNHLYISIYFRVAHFYYFIKQTGKFSKNKPSR